MVNFIKGKWYKSGSYYIKYSHTERSGNSNRIFGETVVSVNKGSYRANDYWANSSMEGDILRSGPITDLSEIIKFLPEGHPDLINYSNTYELW